MEEETRYALPGESESSGDSDYMYEETDSSEDDQPPPPKQGRGRQPGLDDDPTKPCPEDPSYPRDPHGWGRNKVKVHCFRGPKPSGPTFERPPADQALLYFLLFFPLFLFKKIAKWTTKASPSRPTQQKSGHGSVSGYCKACTVHVTPMHPMTGLPTPASATTWLPPP